MKPILLWLALLLIGFTGGVAVGHYKFFPWSLINGAKNAASLDAGAESRRQARKAPRLSLFEAFTPEVDIVFLGDSITAAGLWNEFFEGRAIANRGVGSDRSSDILDRLDGIAALAPARVFLMMGINDITSGRSPAEIMIDYQSTVEALMAAGLDVIIQSTIQCTPGMGRCTAVEVDAVNELNTSLKAYATERGIVFVELGPLSGKQGLPVAFTYDGIHLNGVGYRTWVEAIRPIVSF